MKRLFNVKLCVFIYFLVMTLSVKADELQHSEAPFFKILNQSATAELLLPLKSTHTHINIAGVIADVNIKQHYVNESETSLESIYIFPGSSKAAVYDMTILVDGRRIKAKIQEKQQAKKQYIKAKQQGKTASLLQQHRPNVFQMNVANIAPGAEVMVELAYTELIVPDAGTYEFVYPTVVGPRYADKASKLTETWVNNPYLNQQASVVSPELTINVSIAAGIPVQSVKSPSHNIEVKYNEQGSAFITLNNKGMNPGNRDYILQYQLKGKSIQSGMLLHEGEEENFFLMMMQPPERVNVDEIPSREYIFIVDISGSMHGFPLNTSKKLMLELLNNLNQQDHFNILFFAGGARMLSEQSLAVTKSNIERAAHMLNSVTGSGSTQLLPAIKKAMALPYQQTTSRSFVILTDGYISVETDIFNYIKNNLHQANFFSFGIGSSVNRFLIEGIAHTGKGEAFIVTDPVYAMSTAMKFKRYIETPVLTNIQVQFEGFDAYDIEPFKIPDLFAEKPLLIYGKWQGEAKGKIHIQGNQNHKKIEQTLSVAQAVNSNQFSAIRYLWARQKIKELSDYERIAPSSEKKSAITNLGLSYNLLTQYTAFIAIDEVSSNPGGLNQTVSQPLPLPKGVSHSAVSAVVSTVPEPEWYQLILVTCIAAYLYHRSQKKLSAINPLLNLPG